MSIVLINNISDINTLLKNRLNLDLSNKKKLDNFFNIISSIKWLSYHLKKNIKFLENSFIIIALNNEKDNQFEEIIKKNKLKIDFIIYKEKYLNDICFLFNKLKFYNSKFNIEKLSFVPSYEDSYKVSNKINKYFQNVTSENIIKENIFNYIYNKKSIFLKKNFLDIQNKYKNIDELKFIKNEKIKFYLREKIDFFVKYKIYQETNKNVLDLGSGCGYFPFICKLFDNYAEGTDIESSKLYYDIINILKIKIFYFKINKYEKMPKFTKKYDIITAQRICFNCHGTDNLWGPEEWIFFLKDVFENLLNDGGKIILNLNKENKINKKYNDGWFGRSDVVKLFKNVIVDKGTVIINDLNKLNI